MPVTPQRSQEQSRAHRQPVPECNRDVSLRSSPEPVRSTVRPAAPREGCFGLAILVCLQLCVALPASAQVNSRESAGTGWSTIHGRVIQDGSDAPLPQAQVYIESIDPFAPVASGSDDAMIQAFRMVLTDADGIYSFTRLDAGAYRVHARRPGFKGSSVDVDLRDGGEVRVTLGLEFRPVPIEAVRAIGDPGQPYLRTLFPAAEREGARRSVIIERQADFLGSDVRTLTAGDVLDAITLAEPDIFRALQRMPGVSRRDDYTAVLWTRGAPWVQTRVYFDGQPLYNPTHGGWLFSAVNPDGIGAAVFHPGVRSAQWGEGAAGVLDLKSRTGNPNRLLNLQGELSVASAKIAADGRLPGGTTWMLAGRRTYVDVLTHVWGSFAGNEEAHVPYDFADLVGRIDVPLVAGMSVHASTLLESDRLRGDVVDLLDRNTADWGNRLGRVTARADLGPAVLSATVGKTRFASEVEEETGFGVDDPNVPTLSAMRTSIDHGKRSIRIEGVGERSGVAPWVLGFDRIKEQLSYSGPFSLTSEGIPGLPKVHFDLGPFINQYDAIWAETRVDLFDSFDLETGIRVEFGDSVRNGGDVRVAPRVSGRWQADPTLHVSAGWGRSYQYTQAIGTSGGPLGPQLHLGNLWVLANVGYPALRSDIYTLGVEKWVDATWLVSANTYLREASGITEPDPRPRAIGPDIDYVAASNRARGIELSLRKTVGDWTGAAGYAYGNSQTSASDLTFPSSADVRQTLDLTSSYRFPGGLRLGGALSFASGVPYTRILVADSASQGPPTQGQPNAHRTPAYAGLDVVLDYSTTLGDWNVDMFVQVLNVLNRSNAVTYAGSRCAASATPVGDETCPGPNVFDDFKSGLPRLPLLGVRVAF